MLTVGRDLFDDFGTWQVGDLGSNRQMDELAPGFASAVAELRDALLARLGPREDWTVERLRAFVLATGGEADEYSPSVGWLEEDGSSAELDYGDVARGIALVDALKVNANVNRAFSTARAADATALIQRVVLRLTA